MTTTEKEVPLLALSELTVIKCIDDKGTLRTHAHLIKTVSNFPKNGKERPTIFNPLKVEVNNTEFNNSWP